MKIAYGSDLHFEFGGPRPTLDDIRDADVLVLAGDIAKGRGGLDGAPLFLEYALSYANDLGIPVITVMGNHELYGEEYYAFLQDSRAFADAHDGVHFLEDDAVQVGDVRFLGAMLWSDFKLDKDVEDAMREALIAINDYRLIGIVEEDGEPQALRPHHTARFNAESKAFLRRELARPFDGKTVVVTHFPPIFMSAPQFEGDALSPYFCNGWDGEILYGTLSPDFWISGHTHYSMETTVGRTRLLSQQGGYPGELAPFRWGVVEV